MAEGLLDFIRTPEGQGLLSTVFGGLAGARRGQPLNSLGRAGMSGIMGYGNALERNAQTGKDELARRMHEQGMQLQTMQMDQLRKSADKSDRVDALGPQFFTPGSPAQAGRPAIPGITPLDSQLPPEFQIGSPSMPGTPAKPPSFDMPGYSSALMGADPQKGIALMQSLQKDNTPITVAPGASLVDKHTFRPVFTAPKEMSMPAAIQEYNFAKYQGYDGTFQEFQLSLKKAGASVVKTSVTVDTAPKALATELGKDVAKNIGMARDQADSANQTLANVGQMRSGLAKAITGPFANQRITLNQIGETLGITGQNTAEQLQNTRNVMQGLARQELAAAGQMKGQGQITESERAILRKAESGSINEMTKPEMTTLFTALEKTANYRIGIHQKNMGRMASDKNLADVSKYYEIQPQEAPKSVVKTGMYQGKKVNQYSDGSTGYAN